MSETTPITDKPDELIGPGAVRPINAQSSEPRESPTQNRGSLPFAFARRFGVLLTGSRTPSGSLEAVSKDTLPLHVHAEGACPRCA